MLTWQVHRVASMRLGPSTALVDGALSIDPTALETHLLEHDPRLRGVEFEIASPGELCRIAAIYDTVEPRVRADGRPNFPGILGPIDAAGTGTLRVLRGAAVTMLNPEDRGGRIGLLDMGGTHPEGWTAQDLSVLASVHHLVAIPRLAPGVAGDETLNVLRYAVLRAAVWVADQAVTGTPDEEEVYDLVPSSGLPRVVYVFQMHAQQRPTLPGEPLLYGDNIRHALPALLHPNEVLGGAVVPGYTRRGTFFLQNCPVILDLYAHHGVEVDFVGVIGVVAHNTAEERERTVAMIGQMVKDVLRADGAIFTKTGGGAPNVDMAEMAHRCEELGVKTSFITWDASISGNTEEGSALFSYPDLDAIVNIGANGYQFNMPAMERVIAPWNDGAALERVQGPMRSAGGQQQGVLDQLGAGRFTMVTY